jgi:DNA/RNA endonuclease YhcR with UshA esterase domain
VKTFLVAMMIALIAPAITHAEADGGKKAGKARYDPAKVVTVKGTVLGEQKVDNGKGAKAVRLVLKVGDDQVSVHLGPDSWVDKQALKFTRGDEVTVKGSKFTYENKYGLIAQVITRGDASMVLRDGSGKPAWASK